jgi:signal transduction histidine kinase
MSAGWTSSRKRLALIAAFMVAFLAVLGATTFTLYRRARSHLDNELGERLKSVATNIAHIVETTAPSSGALELLDQDTYTLLYLAREENTLSNIVILTPEGTTILDLEGYSEPGEPNPFVDLDYSAVTLARSGIPSFTNLYRAGDVYMKSAYAPVRSPTDGVVAILGVEADAEFFVQLRELTTLIVVISSLGVTVVIVLGFLFYVQTRSLDRAEAAVAQKENLAAMGRMVANIAHEIRNPLSVIRTSAQRLQRRYGDEDELFSYITDEVDNLNRVLTGYLQFAHSGEREVAPQSAAKVVTRSVMAAQAEADAKRVELVPTLPGEDVTIRGDEKRLRQAVLNVLINAVQACDERGRVEVTLDSTDAKAVITVSDNGHGIDEKDLREITKPFYTRRVDGSGLGLNIVQSIVDEHDGSLDIRSRVGEGTQVTLSFPLDRRG